MLPGLAVALAEELAHLDAAWPRTLPEGVIHADLFPDNVFFLGDALSGIIDFYFACEDFLAYDIAIALNAWCFEPDSSFNVTKAQALIAGYEERRPLSAGERSALPLLALALGLIVFPIDFVLKIAGSSGSGLVGWYVGVADAAFAPTALPTAVYSAWSRPLSRRLAPANIAR